MTRENLNIFTSKLFEDDYYGLWKKNMKWHVTKNIDKNTKNMIRK